MQRRMLFVASATSLTLTFSFLSPVSATSTDLIDTVTQADQNAGLDNPLSPTMVPSGQAVSSQSGDVMLQTVGDHVVVTAESDEGESRMFLEGESSELAVEDGLGVVSPQTLPSISFSISPTSEGSVRVHSVLESKAAPERFTYSFPDADFIEIDEDQGVAFLFSYNDEGTEANITGIVDTPWAVDAKGVKVPTHFEADGNVLSQVVNHTHGDYAYPVTADPDWWSKTKAWFSSASKYVKAKAKGAANWLKSKYTWLKGKTWSGVKWVKTKSGKLVKFAAKRYVPTALVLCAVGGGWAWYRSNASGWVRVGDAVTGCF